MNGPVVTRVKSKKSLDPDAAALAASTDELNLKLAAAEEALRELDLGVEGVVEIDREYYAEAPDVPKCITDLRFRKSGYSWSLVLTIARTNDETADVSVSAGSRELRIKAAMHLGKLLQSMRAQVRAEKQRVAEANAAVDAFLRLAKGTAHE